MSESQILKNGLQFVPWSESAPGPVASVPQVLPNLEVAQEMHSVQDAQPPCL